MTVRPCSIFETCPPDSPIDNFSSEADDPLEYFSEFFAGQPGGGRPDLGTTWSATSCGKTFFSKISQLDADLQAMSAADLCAFGPIVPFLNSPQTCCVFCPDGSQTCYTVPGGLFPGINQASADSLGREVACLLAKRYSACITPTNSVSACLNSPITTTFTAGFPAIWNFTGGVLPPGVTFVGGIGPTASLSGTPVVSGTYNFSISATRLDGPTTTRIFSICITGINPSSLPNAQSGVPYSQTLSPDSCVSNPKWSISSGSLPVGISLDPNTGIISGTTTTIGIFNFTV